MRDQGTGRAGRKARCEYCDSTFVATQEYRGYTRKYCSSRCAARAARAKRRALDPQPEEVWRLYEIEGLSDRDIARLHGRSHQWVFKLRRKYGIPALNRRDQLFRSRGGRASWKSSGGYVVVSTPTGQEYEHRLVAQSMLGRSLRRGEVVHHIDGDKSNNAPSNLRVFDSQSDHMRLERPRKPPGSRAGQRALQRAFNLRLKGEALCRVCRHRAMHLHHAIPRSVSKAARTDLRNGLPLCASCHARWHRHTLTIYRDVFTEEEWRYLSSVRLVGQEIDAWLDRHYPPRPESKAA